MSSNEDLNTGDPVPIFFHTGIADEPSSEKVPSVCCTSGIQNSKSDSGKEGTTRVGVSMVRLKQTPRRNMSFEVDEEEGGVLSDADVVRQVQKLREAGGDDDPVRSKRLMHEIIRRLEVSASWNVHVACSRHALPRAPSHSGGASARCRHFSAKRLRRWTPCRASRANSYYRCSKVSDSLFHPPACICASVCEAAKDTCTSCPLLRSVAVAGGARRT